ncbi:heavy metal translocating P-type ATPase [Brumimicrobium aurantiacum]|uniref:P-type Cu(+) transporter n=1 Tax=Brumimicrobium aurantiacum TaxID=1737063 RepID=A0A3E1EWY4_9FLAO|nr:heavy metal translocating P-type ATPase [Brumimicrobium aurantiacum]RFC54070.1 heavy metal translocating P-type ATPase [Brumimicrobium aurantiacum]
MSTQTIEKSTFPVTGMSCAGCASSVENILKKTDGVSNAEVNFASNTVLVSYDTQIVSQEQLQSNLQGAGYDIIINSENAEEEQTALQDKEYKEVKKRTLWAGILTLPVFILGMFFMQWEPGKYISLIFTIPVLFIFGRSFFINTWKQAKNKSVNMDTLVALSTGIAFTFSVFSTFFPSFFESRGIEAHVYYEAATVIVTFILLGKVFEEKAKSNTSTALKKLMGLQPKTLRAIINGEEQEIPIDAVEKGNTIIIRPGERVPVDGTVIKGNSFVDESMITGEPTAVEKTKGEKVFAGTVNQKGSFQFRAEKVGKDTFLSQIITRVQEAQGSKAPVQKLVDKIASIFVPTVIGIAVLTFIIWMIVGGELAFSHGLTTAIAVLIVACPCALGLATPTAIMVGIGKGAENNILIKDAESLELGHKVDAIILDKTGTITKGKPNLTDEKWLIKENKEVLRSKLLALEADSEHPLADAVIRKLKEDGMTPSPMKDFKSITGQGVQAVDEEGKAYFIGNRALVKAQGITIDEQLNETIQTWQNEAKTVVFFTDEQQLIAILGIADEIKTNSVQAIKDLKDLGVAVYMLTGDNQKTAAAVAKQVGITDFKGDVMPSDKSDFVKKLQKEGRIVAMVGDGINDSEALAQADVSIAMGHGSDIAMDVAKITLTTSDLATIPKALKLSSKTVKGIRQNLFWAFFYNVISIPIAAGVLYSVNGFLLDPMIAGAAMAFSSVSVVLNSLRLKQVKL